eukprot:14044847-Alexandrium_andersonii.AAC.1
MALAPWAAPCQAARACVCDVRVLPARLCHVCVESLLSNQVFRILREGCLRPNAWARIAKRS